jgi:hypothetical protein
MPRRGCLIPGVVAVAVMFALAVNDREAGPPTADQQRSVPHYEGERYTVGAGTTACESLSDFHRIVEFARDHDTTAFNIFLITSTCHVVQRPTEVVVEGHEQQNIMRVRPRGSTSSWYVYE